MFEFIKKWCKKEEKGEKNSMFKVYETELAGRKLTIETGKFAGLANGSVTVRYGDTVVMVNVTASKEPRDGIDFFPLSVDYEEKLSDELVFGFVGERKNKELEKELEEFLRKIRE